MPASVLTDMRGKREVPLPHHLGGLAQGLPGLAPSNVGCVLEDDMDDEDEDFDGDELKGASPTMDASQAPPPGSGPGAPGAGFWLAAVTAATLGPAHGQHPMEHAMTPMNTETGFINSQPSMAEFMTALPHPHMGGDLQAHGPGSLSPQPPGPGGGYPPMADGHPGVNVPEYPWMKEKKTTRKSSQQG
ncbi:hypothetical protein ONE63_003901 [Megalurothrips usitatus]|uniref:Homeotic protein proboscipedia n=1 Tax=Megalurothrips usitatus TaxID=439358 RepID=A0AAV7X4G4_9NEOP|nr:hypothetical protein ONE63_003901 [Megalurothrips usitatus]